MHGATCHALLAVTVLLASDRPCIAEKHECFITETTEGTFYSVPAPKCSRYYYSWSNSSDDVLSNNDSKAEELVNAANGTFLHTYECYEAIKYFSACIDGWEEKTTICEMRCSQSAGVHGSHRRGSGNGAGTSRHLIPAPLVLLSVLLVHL